MTHHVITLYVSPRISSFISAGDVIMMTAMRRRSIPRLLRRSFAAIIPAALVLFLTTTLPAASPSDYIGSGDGWDTDFNLPSSTVTSIAQTSDGYLWVGTYNGLARFDGERFVTFDPVSQPELGQARVQGLSIDANGTLWINTYRGALASYRTSRDDEFRNELPDQSTFDLHATMVSSQT